MLIVSVVFTSHIITTRSIGIVGCITIHFSMTPIIMVPPGHTHGIGDGVTVGTVLIIPGDGDIHTDWVIIRLITVEVGEDITRHIIIQITQFIPKTMTAIVTEEEQQQAQVVEVLPKA